MDFWSCPTVALYTLKLSLKNDPVIQHRNTAEGTLFPTCVAEYKGTVSFLKYMLTEVLTHEQEQWLVFEWKSSAATPASHFEFGG